MEIALAEKENSENALTECENLLKRMIVLARDEHYWALTLWIAFCYSIPEFDFAPRLCFWSPEKRCGKSLALEVVAHLLPNPLMTSSISSPALFRILDKDKTKVILIDESDTVFGNKGDKEKAEALRALLNASFKRGQSVIRCEPPNFEPKAFPIFAPIALAGIGKNAIPETVVDRALMVEMRRILPHEKILEFESDEIEEYFQPVKLRLESFARENESRYRELRPEMPRDSLNPRARDLWKPFYKIAECAGAEWVEKAKLASFALSSGETDPDEGSHTLELLSDIRKIFHESEDRISTKDLIERLRELEESPWVYLERFNPRVIATNLKEYGIKPKPFSGGKIRGYYRKSFEDAWSRYLQPLQTVTPVTPVTLAELDLEAS